MDPLARYFRHLKKILRSRGHSREDAEDLIQEAFLRMQEYCEKGGQVRQPEGFLVRIVLRLAINSRRAAHRELFSDERVEDLPFIVDTCPAPDEVFAADECLNKMRAALDAINPRRREVFFMHRLDGLSYAQIAQQMHLSISAIEKHIAGAMATLASHNESDRK